MGKQTKTKAKAGRSGEKPYKRTTAPAKPTVEVRYEGEAGSSKAAAVPKAAKAAKGTAKAAPAVPNKKGKSDKNVKSVNLSEAAKGKARADPATEAALAVEEAMAAELEDHAEADTDSSAPTFKIVAGSYEKILYGLEGRYAAGAATPTLTPIFIFPAHLAMIKTVAASPGGKWLATGSEDEFVKVWDLRRRKEVGSLSQHTGTITSLTFPTSSHLLTTSADATLSLFRTSDWALLKSLKGHSGRVNHVDIHPTGRVALSVGKDQTLKMWDLMRGRGAASLPLGSEAELVKFSPRGTHFAVLFPKKVEIYSLTLKKLHTLETKTRFNHIAFADLPGKDMEVLCVGTEKGIVEVYSVEIGDDDEDEEDEDENEDEESDKTQGGAEVDRVGTLVGHSNRIKSIATLNFTTPAGPTVLLTTVSSDGNINLHDLALLGGEAEEIQPVATYSTDGSRLICVSIADGGAPRKPKQLQPRGAGEGATRGKKTGARFEDDDDESDEEEEGADMYDSENADDDEEGGMEVEFEDEEEEEDEEEDEEEMEEE